MTTTWAGVHVDDTVRGADQREWTVVDVHAGLTWLGSGVSYGVFKLRLGDGPDAREVTAQRPLHDAAPLVARGDHSAEAAALGALLDAQIVFDLLEETVTAAPPAPVAPADPFLSPAAEPKRDQWGRYLLPDPVTGKQRAWTRATTVARTLADEYALNLWKLRVACKGIALRPDLIASAAAADPETDKGTLNEIAEAAMERGGASSGRNLGTALHTFTQRLDRGEPLASLGAPAPLDLDLAAYQAMLKGHRLGIRPEWIERIVIVPELGIAGTLDRILTQLPGEAKVPPLTVADLKTGKDLSYGWLEIAIQQAIYARASYMWQPATSTYEPMPVGLDRDRALVLHLPVGKSHGQVYGINLIEGWEYVQLAMSVRAARSGAKGLAWLVEPEPADLLMHNVSRVNSRTELARLWELHHPRGFWTDEVQAAAMARLAELEPAALATAS